MNQNPSDTTPTRTCLTEDAWWGFVKSGAIWQRLEPAERRQVLAAPLVPQDAQRIGSRRAGAIASPQDLTRMLLCHDIEPDTPEYYQIFRVFRLTQICHGLGEVHGPNPPAQAVLAARLAQSVLEQKAGAGYTADGYDRYAYNRDKPLVIDLARVNRAGRLRRLLAIPAGGNGIDWEKSCIHPRHSDFPFMLAGNVVFGFVQSLLRRLLDHGGPMPLTTLLDQQDFNRSKQSLLMAKAIRALVNHLLVVVDYAPAAEALRIGFWPGLLEKNATRANAAPSLPPAAAEPEASFHRPLFAEDLALVLAEAFRTPLALKANGTGDLYATTSRRIEEQMPLVPAWADPEARHNIRIRSRKMVDFALWAGYLESKTRATTCLAITPKGIDLLKATAGKRLQTIVDIIKHRTDVNGTLMPWNFSANQGEFFTTGNRPIPINIRQAMAKAWGTLPDDTWFSVDIWLDYLLSRRNPLEMTIGTDGSCGIRMPNSWSSNQFQIVHGEEAGEMMCPWLLRFLHDRLVALGGVELGRGADGKLLLRLTGIGRYFLGQRAKFPELQEAATGRVILQPNFEIVFLGPNLLSRATLARFAEDIAPSNETGTLFRLTKNSIQSYLHASKPADGANAILASLRETCGSALPANVVTEIRSWAAARREFTTRRAVAMTLPDKSTTLLAHGILKSSSTVVNDHTLLLEQALTSGQKKKLAKAGIFEAIPTESPNANRSIRARAFRPFPDTDEAIDWETL